MSEAGLPPGQPAPPATLAPVAQSQCLELRREAATGSEGISSVWYVEESGDEDRFRTNFRSRKRWESAGFHRSGVHPLKKNSKKLLKKKL
jgi:hypothetical protein